MPPAFNSGYLFNASIVQLHNVKQIEPWQRLPTVSRSRRGPAADRRGRPPGQHGWKQTPRAYHERAQRRHEVALKSDPVHVAVTRQGARVRVYFNQEKMWDVPSALLPAAKYNAIVFFIPNIDAETEYFVSNVRLAIGAPDTRNKLLTQGKWVTNGILFDVNSDRIRGETVRDAQGDRRRAHRERRFNGQIVGHTDADGETAANLDLSRRRAASVKTALTTEFKIDAARMDTDGKGESEPADKANTPAGKANNRRVEFIKK